MKRFNARLAAELSIPATQRLLLTIGIALLAGRILLSLQYGGGDFLPVWTAVRALFNHQTPYSVSLFVYPPSSLLLFAPVGLVGFDAAKIAIVVVDAAAIVVAAAVSLRIFGLGWQSAAAAITLIGLGLFAPVTQTLYAANVNGLVVAGEAAALLAAVKQRWLLAGALLGLTFAIKPVLLPLVVLLALERQWRALLISLAIPTILSGLALLISVDGGLFFTRTVPFLIGGEGQSGENISLAGAVAAIGLPLWTSALLRVLVLLAAVAIAWWRWPAIAGTPCGLVEMASLIVITTVLAASFGWPYYGIYLIPLLVSLVDPASAMRSWLGAFGIYGIGGPDLGLWLRGGHPGFVLLHLRFTLGFLLLLAAIGARTLQKTPRIVSGRLASTT
jgi:arabinofuranan 3-O-arabinosyltransferase